MAANDISRLQAAVASHLADGCGPVQAVESCRQVIELCRCVDLKVLTDDAPMGLFRVLGLGSDALKSAQGDLQQRAKEA